MNNYNGYRELNLVGFTDRGEYDPAAEYVKNDLAHYKGSIYKCIVDGTKRVLPTQRSNWDCFMNRLDGGKLSEKEISENGEYVPEEGVDGFSKIRVRVSHLLQRSYLYSDMRKGCYTAHPKTKTITRPVKYVNVGGVYHVSN